MKVASKRTAGLRSGIAAFCVTATVVGVLTGTAVIPSRAASAQIAEVTAGQSVAGAGSLPLAVEEPKADELRAPSGIDVADAKASARRTATPIVRRTAASSRRTSGGSSVPRGWQSARVSWYGPGFYGHTMAGGGNLTPTSMVVAHRSLPFGTRIEFSYKGRTCVAVVRDRGPFVAGRVFDLGPGTAKTLGFSGVGTVNYRILSR